jgi:hypothetical protein
MGAPHSSIWGMVDGLLLSGLEQKPARVIRQLGVRETPVLSGKLAHLDNKKAPERGHR